MNHFRHKITIFIVLVLFFGVVPKAATAADDPLSEYMVKAAFVYNFTKFVEWPPCHTDKCDPKSLIVGVYAFEDMGDHVGEAMATIDGKQVAGRTIIVRHIAKPEEIADCQLLYTTSAEHEDVKKILASAKGHSILTVSDISDFTQLGGMIELIKVGNKMRFAINRKAASDESIIIRAQLLKLATTVIE